MARIARSLLFVPGDRPERFEKAARSGAHEILIDLEDAVSPAAKPAAREAARRWLAQGHRAGVRINGADTPWFEQDLALLGEHAAATVMLPKADADVLAQVVRALPGRAVIALVETVAGYMDLRRLAAVKGLQRIAFGSVDFSVDSGIADVADTLTGVRTQIVLESRYAGLQAPIDGVSVHFSDARALQDDALRSRQLGFGGKLCIHPAQVAPVNAAYQPTADELEWARRVLAADAASGGSATTVDGTLVDAPVVERARRILGETDR